MKDFNSADYWERRYRVGGNSGAGSYNHLALFKAGIINEFIKEHNIKSAVEFGCGDGNNLGLYEIDSYTGLDVSSKAIDMCKSRYFDDSSKKFYTLDNFKSIDDNPYEVALSLDVIFHLVEDSVFDEYMNNLFKYASKYIIIYSSNRDSYHCTHVLHRKFTDWIDNNIVGWKLFQHIKNIYPYDEENPNDTSFSDFYIYKKIGK